MFAIVGRGKPKETVPIVLKLPDSSDSELTLCNLINSIFNDRVKNYIRMASRRSLDYIRAYDHIKEEVKQSKKDFGRFFAVLINCIGGIYAFYYDSLLNQMDVELDAYFKQFNGTLSIWIHDRKMERMSKTGGADEIVDLNMSLKNYICEIPIKNANDRSLMGIELWIDYRTKPSSRSKESKDAENGLREALNKIYSDSKEVWKYWIASLRDRIDEHRTQTYWLDVDRKVTVKRFGEYCGHRRIKEVEMASVKEFLCIEYSNLLATIERVKDNWNYNEFSKYLNYLQRQVRNFEEWPFEHEKKLREHIQMYMTDTRELLRALEWKDFIYRACYDNATFIYILDLEKVGSFC
ncbi:hypothetical protein KY307_01500 [Candidatus Woesearchaeota archaeon]|nr:hypothetical protein [Candidatus Woesearchaeota archaeon]